MALSKSGGDDHLIERQVTGVSDLMFPLDDIPISKTASVKGNTNMISLEGKVEGA